MSDLVMKLTPCWRGTGREWRDGGDYRTQCWCKRHGVYINPSGFTCRLCEAKQWPVETRDAPCIPGACPEHPAPVLKCAKHGVTVTATLCARCKVDGDFATALPNRLIANRAAREKPCAHAPEPNGKIAVPCNCTLKIWLHTFDCPIHGAVCMPDCWVCEDYKEANL